MDRHSLRLGPVGHGWWCATSLSIWILAGACADSSPDPRPTGTSSGGSAGFTADVSSGGGGNGAATGGTSGGGGAGSTGNAGSTSGQAGTGGEKDASPDRDGAADAASAAGAAGSAGAGGGGSDSGIDSRADNANADGAAGSAGAPGQGDAANDATGCPMDSGASCNDATADTDGGMVDNCPNDPTKTEPGACGCGVPDTNTDGDSAADCVDACPTDPTKTQIGICGCNVADPPVLDAGNASCLKGLLAHRYSFSGTGTVATDSIGGANGTILGGSNASLSGGAVSISGDLGAHYTSEGYVRLPPRILDGLTSVTFESWVTWNGLGAEGTRTWQRIFDFGDQLSGGATQTGQTYLFLTPHATSSGFLRVTYSTGGGANETFLNASSSFPTGSKQHVAVVIDAAGPSMALYLNGSSAGTVALPGQLSAIDNANSWLGRSGYSADPEFNGVYDEFRIYRAALTAAQVQASFAAGPNPSFF